MGRVHDQEGTTVVAVFRHVCIDGWVEVLKVFVSLVGRNAEQIEQVCFLQGIKSGLVELISRQISSAQAWSINPGNISLDLRHDRPISSGVYDDLLGLGIYCRGCFREREGDPVGRAGSTFLHPDEV